LKVVITDVNENGEEVSREFNPSECVVQVHKDYSFLKEMLIHEVNGSDKIIPLLEIAYKDTLMIDEDLSLYDSRN